LAGKSDRKVWLEILAANFGWEVWLESLAEQFGWKFGQNIWLESLAGKFDSKVWLKSLSALSGSVLKSIHAKNAGKTSCKNHVEPPTKSAGIFLQKPRGTFLQKPR